MIRHTSFKHGWFYHYRVNEDKADEVCTDFSPLREYLDDIHDNCPDEHFEKGPRMSKQRFNLPLNIYEQRGHIVSDLATDSHDKSHYKTAHSRVQIHMLQSDKSTVAVELPVWMEANECPEYENIFGSTEALTGHIDVLSVEDGKIWVWDYKPKAHKEKYASTQVYFYAYMLSKRTGIPLDKFACGYFDEETAYIFKPEEDCFVKKNGSEKNRKEKND